MFTGIIQAVGQVAQCESRDGDLRLTIDANSLTKKIDAQRFAIGESISVNGVCLTVVEFAAGCFVADVSRETLALTTLGRLPVGTAVNLEAALRAGDPLGGHLMSGHVDGCACVLHVASDARSSRVDLEVPAHLARYLAPKGSVGLDGVSLTVNSVRDRVFGVNLVPHTLSVTNFKDIAPGRQLNLEVDTLARYVERLLVQSRP
jgi:riboflavin synthase